MFIFLGRNQSNALVHHRHDAFPSSSVFTIRWIKQNTSIAAVLVDTFFWNIDSIRIWTLTEKVHPLRLFFAQLSGKCVLKHMVLEMNPLWCHKGQWHLSANHQCIIFQIVVSVCIRLYQVVAHYKSQLDRSDVGAASGWKRSHISQLVCHFGRLCVPPKACVCFIFLCVWPLAAALAVDETRSQLV